MVRGTYTKIIGINIQIIAIFILMSGQKSYRYLLRTIALVRKLLPAYRYLNSNKKLVNLPKKIFLHRLRISIIWSGLPIALGHEELPWTASGVISNMRIYRSDNIFPLFSLPLHIGKFGWSRFRLTYLRLEGILVNESPKLVFPGILQAKFGHAKPVIFRFIQVPLVDLQGILDWIVAKLIKCKYRDSFNWNYNGFGILVRRTHFRWIIVENSCRWLMFTLYCRLCYRPEKWQISNYFSKISPNVLVRWGKKSSWNILNIPRNAVFTNYMR